MCNQGVVPLVLAHARALLTSSPPGRTTYLDADLRDPAAILDAAELHDTLDLTRPVALFLIAILHFVPDDADPRGLIARLVDALAPGSYLALTHGIGDGDPVLDAAADSYRKRAITARLRSRAEVESLFVGLELVDPGVQFVHRWRPDADVPAGLTDAAVNIYGGLARKV